MEKKTLRTVEKILIVATLLIAAGLLVLFTHKGINGTDSEFVYTVREDSYASIDGYTGDKSTLVIPEKVGENDEYTVKYINTDAFTNSTELKKIIIPKSVEVIGKYAFSGCKNLKTVELSDGLREIEFGAFFKCSSLKNVELPETIEIVGDSAFEDCKRIKGLKIPRSCKEIGTDAFLGCENLILDCSENDAAREIAKKYNIPTAFSESSDSTMLKAGILVAVVVISVFVLPKIVKKHLEKHKNSESNEKKES